MHISCMDVNKYTYFHLYIGSFSMMFFALPPDLLGTVKVGHSVSSLFETTNMCRPLEGLTYTRHTHICPTPVLQPCGNNRKCDFTQAKV